jgi:hypothetical protein
MIEQNSTSNVELNKVYITAIEKEFDKKWSVDEYGIWEGSQIGLIDMKSFILQKITEAYKKGFIDGSLSK